MLSNAGVEVIRSRPEYGARHYNDLNFGGWYPQCMEVLNWGEIRYRYLNKKACLFILEAFHKYLGMGYNVSPDVSYGVTNYTLAKNFNKAVKDFTY